MHPTQRRAYYFRGTTKAISALAVNRPDDNFASATGSKDLQRLPRLGPRQDKSPVFFPGTQLRHRIREALLLGACQSAGGRLPLKDHFMLLQGVPIGELAKELSPTAMEGVIEREQGLRTINPLISLGGFWKHAGTLGVDDWLPETTDQPVHYVHSRMRAMPHKRNPALVDYVAEPDISKLKRIMTEDGDIARQVRAIDDDIKTIKKAYAEANTAERKKLGEQINQLEARRADVKGSKEGATETLERPLEGYEAIIPGTVMRSGLDIARASELDLGFILYALRHISQHPYVGAHYADGKGEFALDWQVRTWGEALKAPITLGRVKVALLEFEIIPEGDNETLNNALKLADAAFANPAEYGLDFSLYKV